MSALSQQITLSQSTHIAADSVTVLPIKTLVHSLFRFVSILVQFHFCLLLFVGTMLMPPLVSATCLKVTQAHLCIYQCVINSQAAAAAIYYSYGFVFRHWRSRAPQQPPPLPAKEPAMCWLCWRINCIGRSITSPLFRNTRHAPYAIGCTLSRVSL